MNKMKIKFLHSRGAKDSLRNEIQSFGFDQTEKLNKGMKEKEE